MANIDFKSPGVQKVALSILLAGGIVAVFFFTHYLPFSYPNQRDRLNVLKADYEKKSTELARARASVADLPRFEAEYEQLHERWTAAAELLPAERQLAAMLRKITLAGQQTGVQFVLFRPGAPRSETYYTELPVEVTVYGGYHQVGSFLAELANMRRIVTVANVRLTTNSKGDDSQTTSASLTASAYSLNPSANTTGTASATTTAPVSTGGAAAPTPAAQKGEPNAQKQS
jgi:type IV pilus assembly protein PilO